MQRLHGRLAAWRDAASCGWNGDDRAPISVCGRITLIRKTKAMTRTENQSAPIAARTLPDEADAVLEQMFGYFTREDAPRAAGITRRAA